MSDRSNAERAVQAMQSEAFNFASRFINDAAVRRNYLQTVQRYSQDILERGRRGQITWRAAAEEANVMRNSILDVSRLRSSDIGRATAERLKASGLSLDELLERYAQRRYRRGFQALSAAERNAVFVEIVEASGRARASVNVNAVRLGRLGRGLLGVSLAIAVYNVASAENRVEAATREGVGLGGGFLGGAAGGAAAGLVCGPGAPVCVTIGVFVGGVAGALGADFLYDWLN
jgi:hypothetical protein